MLLRVFLLALLLFGAANRLSAPAPPPDGIRVVPGVAVRRLSGGVGGVRTIDIDLAAQVRVEVAAEEIAVRRGLITGRARTLPDWLRATGAVAGINGGFFGETVAPDHKEIVGLLKREGRVRVAAPRYRARGSGKLYARAALGFTQSGRPRIAWVSSGSGSPQALFTHPEPDDLGRADPWEVRQALACGPQLIREGRTRVTDRGERLVSPGQLPRTFLGFGGRRGAERLVLCAATGMEFAECERFLAGYFRRYCGVPCAEAMCLDGGASTQAAWRENGRITADPDPGTTVPTALLIHVKR